MRANAKINRTTRRGTRRRSVPVLRTVPLPLMVGGTALALTGAMGLWQILPGEVTPTVGAGHGRGMSQVGAFENAQEGWTAEEILGHYYPGAELGQIGPTTIGVRLQAQDDATLDTFAAAGAQVAGRTIGPGEAAHLTPLPDGGANVVVTSGCDGEVLWQAATDDPFVYPVSAGAGRPADEHLTLCGGTAYRGALGVALEDGAYRTVNQVDLDDYLAGLLPAEMQANWADQGAFEALRAQAIAARSYALAEDRYTYAQTCDTTDCQVYPGTVLEDARTTEAVAATTGTVLLRDGLILRSEYSAAPDGGRPADIQTFEVGPAPDELVQTAPAPPAPAYPADPATPTPTLPDPTIEALAGESLIDTAYRRIGGPDSAVGAPIGPEMLLPQRAGTYRMYTNGVIVATPTLGAQVVDFSTLLALVPDAGDQLPTSGSGQRPRLTMPEGTTPNGDSPGSIPEGTPPDGGSPPVANGVAPEGQTFTDTAPSDVNPDGTAPSDPAPGGGVPGDGAPGGGPAGVPDVSSPEGVPVA
ncbi:SpoIID/LytB domain-containing protein [Nocardia sp. NPDC059177]|uniref:SpoIID/LytB domain-containing protein n=1 Tax=Nocardia sp. NPDC059177 TaxID=3346759 RepID=UPI0036975C83